MTPCYSLLNMKVIWLYIASAPPPITMRGVGVCLGMGRGIGVTMKICQNFVVTNFFLHFWKDKPLGVIQKVRSLRREGGPLKSKQKRIGGEGFLACVYVLISLKIQRFSKWSFIVILQFFLLIIMAVWNIKQTIKKDYDIQSCQWMVCDRFLHPFLLCTTFRWL